MHVHGISKNGTDESMCKAETEAQTQKTDVWTTKGGGGHGMYWEIGIDIYTLLIVYIKSITNGSPV